MVWRSEALLTAVAEASPRDCITEARMAELTGADAASIEASCNKLRRHGLMEKTARGCHKLTKAGLAAVEQGKALRSGPKGNLIGVRTVKGTLRTRTWSAIRLLKKFSLDDLYLLVAQGGERDIASNTRKYVKALQLAGYLQRLKVRERGTAPTSNGKARWLLTRDTGHDAPIWSADKKQVYDPNTTETHPCG